MRSGPVDAQAKISWFPIFFFPLGHRGEPRHVCLPLPKQYLVPNNLCIWVEKELITTTCNYPQVQVSAKHARDGRISARFYTNNWPEFSTVVARITTPRLSEVNLYHHSIFPPALSSWSFSPENLL